jgi:hypothetical protein
MHKTILRPIWNWITSLGYGFHFQHRKSGRFQIERFANDSGRASVRAEYGYPKESPNTNRYRRILRYSYQQSASPGVHPNDLTVNLMD